MTQLWWNAGGAKPVVAADFRNGLAIDFRYGSSVSYAFFNKNIEVILTFDCELTDEQITIASKLVDSDEAYPGHYLSWQHFAFTHGLEDVK